MMGRGYYESLSVSGEWVETRLVWGAGATAGVGFHFLAWRSWISAWVRGGHLWVTLISQPDTLEHPVGGVGKMFIQKYYSNCCVPVVFIFFT